MHTIAEGFDSETNAEFIRFLRYAKRSCTEVQSELYVALDEEYISPNEFKDVYEQARRTRAAIRGFINYLKKYEERKETNREPWTVNQTTWVVTRYEDKKEMSNAIYRS